MKQITPKHIRAGLGIALSASLVLSGCCLMTACVGIYRSGPFTREAVAAAFSPIAWSVYLAIALAVAAAAAHLILPKEEKKRTADKQTGVILSRLQAKADLDSAEESLRSSILSQRSRRKKIHTVSAVVIAICCIIPTVYCLNGSNFHQSQITESMIRAMWILLPAMAVAFGCGLFRHYSILASMEAEIALLKQAPKGAATASAPAAGQISVKTLRTCLLVLTVAVLVYGFFAGGTADVLTKAVNICTECVGLG